MKRQRDRGRDRECSGDRDERTRDTESRKDRDQRPKEKTSDSCKARDTVVDERQTKTLERQEET